MDVLNYAGNSAPSHLVVALTEQHVNEGVGYVDFYASPMDRERELSTRNGVKVFILGETTGIDGFSRLGPQKYIVVRRPNGDLEARIASDSRIVHRSMVLQGERVVGAGWMRLSGTRLEYDGFSGAYRTMRDHIKPEDKHTSPILDPDAGLQTVQRFFEDHFKGVEVIEAEETRLSREWEGMK